jgi:hypothetical protein
MSIPLPTGPIQGASVGDELKYAEHQGSLLLVVPTEHVQSIQTVHGMTDAVRANVIVLDGPQAGRELQDTLIFPRVLKSSLKGKIGQIVVGRLGQGQAKVGQNAPWIFITPSDAELAHAQQYVAQRAASQVSAPAQPPVQSAPVPHMAPQPQYGQQTPQYQQAPPAQPAVYAPPAQSFPAPAPFVPQPATAQPPF